MKRSLVLVLALTGCAVGPDYHKPETPTPDGFTDPPDLCDPGSQIAVIWRINGRQTTAVARLRSASTWGSR